MSCRRALISLNRSRFAEGTDLLHAVLAIANPSDSETDLPRYCSLEVFMPSVHDMLVIGMHNKQ